MFFSRTRISTNLKGRQVCRIRLPDVIVAVSAPLHLWLFHTVDLHGAPLAIIVTDVLNGKGRSWKPSWESESVVSKATFIMVGFHCKNCILQASWILASAEASGLDSRYSRYSRLRKCEKSMKKHTYHISSYTSLHSWYNVLQQSSLQLEVCSSLHSYNTLKIFTLEALKRNRFAMIYVCPIQECLKPSIRHVDVRLALSGSYRNRKPWWIRETRKNHEEPLKPKSNHHKHQKTKKKRKPTMEHTLKHVHHRPPMGVSIVMRVPQ